MYGSGSVFIIHLPRKIWITVIPNKIDNEKKDEPLFEVEGVNIKGEFKLRNKIDWGEVDKVIHEILVSTDNNPFQTFKKSRLACKSNGFTL